MKKYFIGITQSVLVLMLLFVLSGAQFAVAEGNISDTNKWAWSENAGWLNFRSSNGGVTVQDTYLSGYAWGENVGWIKLGHTPWGGRPV
jgi:hypothetical protein